MPDSTIPLTALPPPPPTPTTLDRAAAERVLSLEFPTLSEEGRKAALDRAYADQLWSVDGFISQAAVDTCMNVLTTSGLLEGTWNYTDMVDMQFVEAFVTE